jgi:uncharacterized protein YndB with AHSA1/START domain
MLSFLKWAFLSLLVIVAGVAGFVAMQPSHFEVSRSTEIDAPPDAVFEQVNDLHKWGAWDPWATLDPNATTTFDGPGAGKGAKMSWDGNDKVGAGSMTIVDAKTPDSIALLLQFKRPMEGVADTLFTFTPVEPGKTKVTWKMSGENGFIGKAFSLIMDCEKMVGPDFERGLAGLKKVSEAEAAKKAS